MPLTIVDWGGFPGQDHIGPALFWIASAIDPVCHITEVIYSLDQALKVVDDLIGSFPAQETQELLFGEADASSRLLLTAASDLAAFGLGEPSAEHRLPQVAAALETVKARVQAELDQLL